jgi:hypothetical protein
MPTVAGSKTEISEGGFSSSNFGLWAPVQARGRLWALDSNEKAPPYGRAFLLVGFRELDHSGRTVLKRKAISSLL